MIFSMIWYWNDINDEVIYLMILCINENVLLLKYNINFDSGISNDDKPMMQPSAVFVMCVFYWLLFFRILKHYK